MDHRTVNQSPRFASMVMRYHTWPTIQQQTNADHSFNVLRIYCEIYGPPEPEVTLRIVQHDLGEIVTGDAPFPIKRDNPVLKAEHDRLEDQALEEMGFMEEPDLDEEQARRVKVCDLLEMHEFGRVEVAMGNLLAYPIIEVTQEAAWSMIRDEDEKLRIVDYLSRSVGGIRS